MRLVIILNAVSSSAGDGDIYKVISSVLAFAIAIIYFVWRYDDRKKKKSDGLAKMQSDIDLVKKEIEEVKKKEMTERHGDRIIVLETDSKSLKATVSRMEKHFETIVAMLHEMKGELKNKP